MVTKVYHRKIAHIVGPSAAPLEVLHSAAQMGCGSPLEVLNTAPTVCLQVLCAAKSPPTY